MWIGQQRLQNVKQEKKNVQNLQNYWFFFSLLNLRRCRSDLISFTTVMNCDIFELCTNKRLKSGFMENMRVPWVFAESKSRRKKCLALIYGLAYGYIAANEVEGD